MKMDDKIAHIIVSAIQEKIFPGAVIGYIKNGKKTVLPFGSHTYEEDSTKVKEDSIYDVASITKAIPTSCLAIKLIGEGKCSLDDTIRTYLPQLSGRYKDAITLRHLLTQTLEFPFSLSSFSEKTAEEILGTIYTCDLVSPPGEKYVYTNATSILLGLVIEEITKSTLDTVADEYFFTPLQMTTTTFHPELFIDQEIVPTEITGKGEVIQGVVHDESARILSRDRAVGSAGLFSTVPDLLRFLQMLLGNGQYDGVSYFSQEQIKMMATNQLESIKECAGLGWELCPEWYGNTLAMRNVMSKTGFTGCVFVCDVYKQTGFVLLSNYNYPRRKKDKSKRNRVFYDLAKCLFSSSI